MKAGRSTFVFLASVLGWCGLTRVEAQDEAAAVLRLPDTFVTAQRLPEPAAAVPVSMTVVSGDTVRDADLTDLGQIAELTPNFFLEPNGFRRSPNHSLRGISSIFVTGAPGFALYVDDVPQIRLLTFNTELFDLERIEVLRGPHGTLYGRDAIGGVVNVVTREPSAQLAADGSASAGNYDLHHVRAAATGPLGSDAVLLSVSGAYLERDGYTENDVDGDDIDSRSGLAGRVKLTLPPARIWSCG